MTRSGRQLGTDRLDSPADDEQASWVRRLRRRLGLVPALGVAGALDATILPGPLELLMIAGMLAKRELIWPIVAAVTIGCIVGSALGYAAGAFLLDPVVTPLLDRFGGAESFEAARQHFRDRGVLAIVVICLTPIPLPLASLGAGATGMNPILAVALIGAIRGVRYAAIGAAVILLGPAVERIADRLAAPWLRAALIAAGLAATVLVFFL